MFGAGELSSLTWDSAAWIYSVINRCCIGKILHVYSKPITRTEGYQILLSTPSFNAFVYSVLIPSMVYRKTGLHNDRRKNINICH